MATTVAARRNHYDTLGLSPRATRAEIAEAFGREILLSRTRAFGSVAEVSIAYETLRDPAKRQAYDESIGVNRPPPAVRTPTAVSFRSSAHFIGAAPEPKADPLPPREEPQPETEPEARTASFIAASLRSPEFAPEPDQAPIMRLRRPMPPIADADVEEQGFEWRRPAIAASIIISGVALLGAWAGIEAGNDAENAQAAVTVPVPSAKAKRPATAEAVAETPPATIALAPPQARPRLAARATRRAEPKPVEQVGIHREAPTGPFEEIAANQAVEAAPALNEGPVEAAPANLPLSKAAIAHTIARIGYRCGEVASTSQILGNAFKVTCTSGDSYRAAPVHGRYRFKRLGSH